MKSENFIQFINENEEMDLKKSLKSLEESVVLLEKIQDNLKKAGNATFVKEIGDWYRKLWKLSNDLMDAFETVQANVEMSLN